MNELLTLTIRQVRDLYARKSLSPLEYWQAVEDRIAAFEPHVQALYLYDPTMPVPRRRLRPNAGRRVRPSAFSTAFR